MAQVTDEMVEKAWEAGIEASVGDGGWITKPCVRAALESVADDLRAEGMEAERSEIYEAIEAKFPPCGSAMIFPDNVESVLHLVHERGLARANQLSQTSKGDGE